MLNTVVARPVRLATSVHPDSVADLQALGDRLATAGLSSWLVRHKWGVAVAIASPVPGTAVADAVLRVLADLRGDGFDWAEAAPGIVRLGRSSDTSRWVELEHWNISARSVTCARANALTREQFDVADVEPVTMELFGRQWHTLAGMFDAHADDVGHDIDVVFSWVDGTDPAFLFLPGTGWWVSAGLGDGDDADARTRQIDELRYALRSVDQNAPWVRRIFIATDTRLPGWLIADHPKITVVRASEHFSDPAALPTFNSHAVESQLHHIDGLAEHFLYCNDDMFFGRPVAASVFFTPAGISRFIESPIRIGGGAVGPSRSGHENAARNNRHLLAERFGYLITRHLAHSPVPLRRSVLAELEGAFPDEFAATQASRFRSATDISVTNSLYHYYALLTGRGVPHESARACYIDTTSHDGLRSLAGLSIRRDADFFCLNDGSEPEVDETYYLSPTMSNFLIELLPRPTAPWETGADHAVQITRMMFVASRGVAVTCSLPVASAGNRRVELARSQRCFRDDDPGPFKPRLRLPRGDRLADGRAALDRHNGVHHRLRVDLHQAERLRGVVAAGAGLLERQVLGVAGRRGHRDRDAGEGTERRVVQVTGQNGTHVGAFEHGGEPMLLDEFDGDSEVGDRRQRRVMHGENGPARRGNVKHPGKPRQLRIAHLAVVMAGHAGVQRHNPQAVHQEHLVQRPPGGWLA